MRKRLLQDQLKRTAERLRQQPVHNMKFEDAFGDTLALMDLMIDMTVRFGSSRKPPFSDHCGSLPSIEQLYGQKFKARRNKP